MAWVQSEIGIGETTVMGNVNESGEKTRIEMPFNEAFMDATELTIGGKRRCRLRDEPYLQDAA